MSSSILFVPGNHDPEDLYSRKIVDFQGVNIHKSVYKLASGLVAIGLGGCCKMIEVDSSGKDQDVFNPYPYNTDEEYFKDLY